MATDKDKQLQQLYLQLQLVGQQIQELETQSTLLNTQLGELRKLKDSVGELGSVKASSQTFAQVGAGVFVKSQIVDTSEVLVNVGAGVFVNKSVPDAQSTIENQVEMSAKYLENMNANLQILNQQAAALQEQGKGLVK